MPEFLRSVWSDPVWSKVISAGIITVLATVGTWLLNDQKTKWPIIGMIVLGVGFVICFVWYRNALNNIAPATPTASDQLAKPSSEITIKYLYDHDFGNTFMTQNVDFNIELKVNDKPVAFSFSARLIFDFEHRARWLYYYIPLNKDTLGICFWLIAHTEDIVIPKMDNDINITNSGMLGSGALSGKDLTFSRRIYIYHEMILTDFEMADLQHDAKEKNINIVFRGISYQQMMTNK
jgi:hypothetical protein